MFSHSRRGDDHSVCLCLGFKVISSSASEQWSVAGLICKILLLQNVDNSIIYFSWILIVSTVIALLQMGYAIWDSQKSKS